MNSLILGGAGYIGSHMVRALLRQGFPVCVLDDLSTGHRQAVDERAQLIQGSILDPAALDAAIEQSRPDCIFHFAARSLVGQSMEDPGLYYRNNVGGTLEVVSAMRRHQVPALVFSSTAAVYGNAGDPPLIDEDSPRAPINPYGHSKLFAEQLIADHCRAHGLRATALRYFNAAGADPAGGIGESHQPETHLIPNILRAARGELAQVMLFGDRHATADGYCVRDFVHVNDLCQAHLLAAQRLLGHASPAFSVFNLGSERGYSVIEVLRAAEAVVGHAIPSSLVAARAGDPPRLVASAQRARSELGWQPQFQQLTDIIGSAWRWHRQPLY